MPHRVGVHFSLPFLQQLPGWCFGTTEIQGHRQVWSARHGSPRTLSRTTGAKLETHVFVSQKKKYGPANPLPPFSPPCFLIIMGCNHFEHYTMTILSVSRGFLSDSVLLYALPAAFFNPPSFFVSFCYVYVLFHLDLKK